MKWHQQLAAALLNVAAFIVAIPAYAVIAMVLILAWTWPLIAILMIVMIVM